MSAFAVVLFGDGKSYLFNTNCRNISLLQMLRQACNEVCKYSDQIDLAAESGEFKNLNRRLESYASDVIAPRERLVLLRIEAKLEQNGESGSKLIPLLNGAMENQKFMCELNRASQKSDNSAKKPAATKNENEAKPPSGKKKPTQTRAIESLTKDDIVATTRTRRGRRNA